MLLLSLFEQIKDYIVNNIWRWIFIVFCFFAIVIVTKVILKAVKGFLNKARVENIAQGFIIAFLKFALYIVGVLILLSAIGIQISGIITALSAVFLAIGLALQNIISNVANGIVIISTKLFKNGDFISLEDVSGHVTSINFLFTMLNTVDNTRVSIPNSKIINAIVLNYDMNDKRRLELNFFIGLNNNITEVKKLILNIVSNEIRVLKKYVKPICEIKEINSNQIILVVYCWCKKQDYYDLYYVLMEKIVVLLKEKKISMPVSNIAFLDINKQNQ